MFISAILDLIGISAILPIVSLINTTEKEVPGGILTPENIKNYKTNEFLKKFNTTIDHLYTSLSNTLTANYKLGEDYITFGVIFFSIFTYLLT